MDRTARTRVRACSVDRRGQAIPPDSATREGSADRDSVDQAVVLGVRAALADRVVLEVRGSAAVPAASAAPAVQIASADRAVSATQPDPTAAMARLIGRPTALLAAQRDRRAAA